MNSKSFSPRLINILTLFVLCLFLHTSIRAQESDEGGGILFGNFKTAAKKFRCGERDEAIRLGNELIEKYGNDENNKDVVAFVRKRISSIKEEDRICRRDTRYNTSFKTKNWSEFLKFSKEVIAEEGDSELALDVMLTMVSVGFDRAAVVKVDIYNNNDTLSYAKLAIQRIEKGQRSKTGNWGVFEPFSTKDDALSWMNYIIGWQMFYKLNQKKEALGYFYRATQTGKEKKNDITIYTNIGQYYFEETERLVAEVKEKRKANNNRDKNKTKTILALAKGNADRAIDAFGRAYKIALMDKRQNGKEISDMIHKTISELYLIRFQIDVDKYTNNLIAKPMPDPLTPVKPIL